MTEPRTAVALFDRTDRARLDVSGPDAAKFLHNLTTNDIKGLAAGRGCEAFVTSPQGKTLGYVLLHAHEHAILLRADPGGLEHVLPHFARYAVFDDVARDDLGDRTFEVHLAGPEAETLVRRLGAGPPAEVDLAHLGTSLAGRPVGIIRESPTGLPGLTLIGARDDRDAVLAALREAGGPIGLVEPDASAFESWRIEAGTPVFGRDVTPENLPQEVDRNARAISLTKGCYLGQETVARLDALGHVNKVLKGLRIAGDAPPPPGTPLTLDGKPAGTITSSARATDDGSAVALAYVRAKVARPGTRALAFAAGDGDRRVAVVSDLPMGPQGVPD